MCQPTQHEAAVKNSKTNPKSTLKKIILNILVVLGIGMSSMISTQAAKSVYSENFNATYFVAYTTTTFNVIMFPSYLIVHLVFGLKPRGIIQLLNHCIEPYKREREPRRYTYFRLWWVMICFTALWISAIYTYIKSLLSLNPTDLFSVIIAVTGVVVFFYSEEFKFDKTVGILIALATSFLSALYKVIYKTIIRNGTMAQVSFALSVIGINTALYYWPFILIFHYTDYELIPSSIHIPWRELSIRGSCSVIMNFFITFGIAFISSLVASVGGILAIPLNAIVDVILKRKVANLLKAIGSILIVCSFSILLIPDSYFDKLESFWRKKRLVVLADGENPPAVVAELSPAKASEV